MSGINIKLIFRTALKEKYFYSLSLIGLTVGICSFIILQLYTLHELSFDTFHRDSDAIYRITTESRAVIPAPIVPALASEIAGVEEHTMIQTSFNDAFITLEDKNKVFEDRLVAVDSSFFKIFSFKSIIGNIHKAIKDPGSIIITQKTAHKYFGDSNPLGKRLSVENFPGSPLSDLQVAGIIENPPTNSHIQFDLIISLENSLGAFGLDNSWTATTVYGYVKLTKNFKASELQDQIPDLYKSHTGHFPKREFQVQPLKNVHLHSSHLQFDMYNANRASQVYTLWIVGLLILFIACINYVNLSTAQYSQRMKEVGIKKVLGISKKSLISRFLIESFVLVGVSILLSAYIIYFLKPYLHSEFNLSFSIVEIGIWKVLGVGMLFVLFVTLLSGLYPALFLSKISSIELFRESQHSGKTLLLRSFLVILQFIVSCLLLMSTHIIRDQTHYMYKKDLGFDTERLVTVQFPFTNNSLHKNFQTVRNRLLSVPGVQKVGFSSQVPGRQSGMTLRYGLQGITKPISEYPVWHTFLVDPSFIEVLDFEFFDGRNFERDLVSDSTAFILNKVAVRSAIEEAGEDWEHPIGKTLSYFWPGPNGAELLKQGPVIGILEDFHFQSLHHQIRPVVMQIDPQWFRSIAVKSSATNLNSLIQTLDKIWREYVPNQPLDYQLFNDSLKELYAEEERQNNMFRIFSSLAIVVSLIGLVGLVKFSLERRRKEMSIRKVLGSNISELLVLIVKDYMKLILISITLSLPLGYLIMKSWLNEFAFRTDISVDNILLSPLFIVIITLLIICPNAWKIARDNPIKNLRSE